MAELAPMFLTNLCYTAQDFRRETTGLVCAEGVTDRTGLKVTTGGSGLNLFVSAGSAYVQGDDAADQGIYFVNNDAQVTLTDTAADPTNPRIDTVVATVRDSDYGGTDDDWLLQIVPGTPTVGATLANLSGAAALPDSSLLLAYVLVPATFAGPFVNATHILDARTTFVACGDKQVYSTKFTRSTTVSLTNGTLTTVGFPAGASGTAVGDDWLTESGGSVTVKRTGVFLIQGAIEWAANADSNRRAVRLDVGGTGFLTQGPALNSATLATNQSVSATVPVAAGTVILLQGQQASGGNLNVATASLTITRVGTLVA